MTPTEFRDIRLALGLSQTDWGLALGVSRLTIHRAEHGKAGDPIENLMMARLAEAIAAGHWPSDVPRPGDHACTVLLAASRRPG